MHPCRCTAHLDLHRTPGDALLPGTKALVQLDSVQVQLNPSSVAIVNQSLLQLCTAADPDDSAVSPEGQHQVIHTEPMHLLVLLLLGGTLTLDGTASNTRNHQHSCSCAGLHTHACTLSTKHTGTVGVGFSSVSFVCRVGHWLRSTSLLELFQWLLMTTRGGTLIAATPT